MSSGGNVAEGRACASGSRSTYEILRDSFLRFQNTAETNDVQTGPRRDFGAMIQGEGAGIAAQPGAATRDAAPMSWIKPIGAPFEQVTGEIMQAESIRFELPYWREPRKRITVTRHASASLGPIGVGFFS